VDTVATPPRGDLKLIWADSAKMAVTTDSIVKDFDVVSDVFVRKIAVLVDVLLDPFLLQASEERFSDWDAPISPDTPVSYTAAILSSNCTGLT